MEVIFFASEDIVAPGDSDTTFLRITDVKAVLNDGTILEMHGQKVALHIDSPTATYNPGSGAFRIYPNPSNGRLYIEKTDLRAEAGITLYDVHGAPVFESTFSDQVEVTGLATGIYFLVIRGEQTYASKIVVMQ